MNVILVVSNSVIDVFCQHLAEFLCEVSDRFVFVLAHVLCILGRRGNDECIESSREAFTLSFVTS